MSSWETWEEVFRWWDITNAHVHTHTIRVTRGKGLSLFVGIVRFLFTNILNPNYTNSSPTHVILWDHTELKQQTCFMFICSYTIPLLTPIYFLPLLLFLFKKLKNICHFLFFIYILIWHKTQKKTFDLATLYIVSTKHKYPHLPLMTSTCFNFFIFPCFWVFNS